MDMNNLMKQAQQFQQNLKALQDELAGKEVTGSAGAGMVRATFNGQCDLVALHMDAELVTPENTQMLQDLLQAAINDGLRKAKELAKGEMSRLTGGISIPGLM
ncbi:MAG: YbaB/EbfC family nucleoid-associated protein [Desulfobulbaceae bacterium]|nr:YbaB/EbfC family nucleoid-associated protein [Desulfobulbaceae bacterium]